jgi:hypothetical protein
MTAWGQNPNPSPTLACQLPPAADMTVRDPSPQERARSSAVGPGGESATARRHGGA